MEKFKQKVEMDKSYVNKLNSECVDKLINEKLTSQSVPKSDLEQFIDRYYSGSVKDFDLEGFFNFGIYDQAVIMFALTDEFNQLNVKRKEVLLKLNEQGKLKLFACALKSLANTYDEFCEIESLYKSIELKLDGLISKKLISSKIKNIMHRLVVLEAIDLRVSEFMDYNGKMVSKQEMQNDKSYCCSRFFPGYEEYIKQRRLNLSLSTSSKENSDTNTSDEVNMRDNKSQLNLSSYK